MTKSKNVPDRRAWQYEIHGDEYLIVTRRDLVKSENIIMIDEFDRENKTNGKPIIRVIIPNKEGMKDYKKLSAEIIISMRLLDHIPNNGK